MCAHPEVSTEFVVIARVVTNPTSLSAFASLDTSPKLIVRFAAQSGQTRLYAPVSVS